MEHREEDLEVLEDEVEVHHEDEAGLPGEVAHGEALAAEVIVVAAEAVSQEEGVAEVVAVEEEVTKRIIP